MSAENVQLIRDSTAAGNRKDWDAVLATLSPAFELDMSRATGPFQGRYGIEEVRGFLEDFFDSWESVEFVLEEFIEADDVTVVPQSLRARGRSGIEVEARPTMAWTVREGKIQRITMYQEREDALEDLGIPEPA